MKNQATLIVGANSEIAKALALKIIESPEKQLIVVSRNIDFYQQSVFIQANVIQIESYQEESIQRSVNKIQQLSDIVITEVYICHGLLHSNNFQPEKRLEDFSANAFTEVITANSITPMLWLKTLTPLLTCKTECRITFFSARVGSISDNKLGGWYSYRASKAALNMLLKSAAVELARRAKNIKLISFHPGTTNSPLSKPFQKNVPEGKLFTSEYVAVQLLDIVQKSIVDGEASYVDWEGKVIPW